MKRKIICITLMLSCMLGMTAYASESSNESDCVVMSVSEEKAAQLEQAVTTSKDYTQQVYLSTGLYEYNDTIETAFEYVNTTKIEHRDNEPNGHFNCYYAYTNLESEDDIDYFKVEVRPGIRYVAALKNVWLGQIRDMKLYYKESNGEWRQVTADAKTERQTIFHFWPIVDTYYIEISGEPTPGYKHDSSTNWFAVAPDGTIDERPLVGSKKPSCSLQ